MRFLEKDKSQMAKEAAERFSAELFIMSAEDFLGSSFLKDGLYHLLTKGAPVDVLIIRGESFPGSCVLTFNGALSEKARKLNLVPNFTGVAITQELGSSLVAISDPATYMDADVYIGWYLGNGGENLQKLISRIIEHTANSLQVTFCAFGGSGGGFASLYFLANCDSVHKALVWNCQTVVEKYYPRFWKRIAEILFGEKDVDGKRFSELFRSQCIATSLLDNVDKFEGKSFFYLQNGLDWHLKNHAEPFVNKLGLGSEECGSFSSKNDLVFFQGNWGEGHAVPPKSLLTRCLKNYLIDDLKSVRKTLSQHRFYTGGSKIVKDARLPDFDVYHDVGGVRVVINDSKAASAALYQKKNNSVYKKHGYTSEKIFFVECPISFKGISYVLFSKYPDGSVRWREVSDWEIVKKIECSAEQRILSNFDGENLKIQVVGARCQDKELFCFYLVRNGSVVEVRDYAASPEAIFNISVCGEYSFVAFIKRSSEVRYFKGGCFKVEKGWRERLRKRYSSIISGGYASLKKEGYKLRSDVSPVNISPDMSWRHSDKNAEFSLHTLRFFAPFWGELFSTGDQLYLNKCIELLDAWYNNGSNSSGSRFYWYDMAVGIRAQHISLMIELSEFYPIGDCELILIRKVADAHIEKLVNPKLLGHGNHAVYQMVGLKQLLLSSKNEKKSNYEYCDSVIRELVDYTFDENYVNVENSPFYHGYNLDIFVRMPRELFPKLKDRLENIEKYGREVKRWLTSPNGSYYPIGDTEGKGELLKLRPECFDISVGGVKYVSRDYASSGYQIIRSHPEVDELNNSYLVFHATSKSKIHSHCDQLSLIFSWRGVDILTDPGKYTYESNRWRQHFLSDRAHNTFGVEGRSFYPVDVHLEDTFLNSAVIDKESFEYRLSGQTCRSGIFFHREVFYKPGKSVCISDSVVSSVADFSRKELRYQLGPLVVPRVEGSDILLSVNGMDFSKVSFDVAPDSIMMHRGDEESCLGWLSSSYNSKEPSVSLIIGFSENVKSVFTCFSLL